MVELYLNYCTVFGEQAIYPWSEFMKMPYNTIIKIIEQKNKRNEAIAKEYEKAKNKIKSK